MHFPVTSINHISTNTPHQAFKPLAFNHVVLSITLNSTFPVLVVAMETPTKGTPFKWDAETERDMFAACLVAAGEPKGPTLKKAMDILNENYGKRFTQKAASHRL